MVKYKLKAFAKWAKKVSVADWQLCAAIEEMNQGLLGDRLGAYVYKKRIAASGHGKRGGARTIICFRKDDKAIFLYGYAKNEVENLEENELLALREYAKELISLTNEELAVKVTRGALLKVEDTN